jgi:hypothetical protein
MLAEPTEALLALLMVATYSTVGLLASWAALGIGPWFMRLLPLGIAGAVVLAIPAPELAVVICVQAAIVFVSLIGWRIARTTSSSRCSGSSSLLSGCWINGRVSYSILDLLMATVVVAAVLTGYQRYSTRPAMDRPQLVLLGSCLGGVTLVAAWSGLSRQRWSYRIVGTALGLVLAASILTLAGSFLDAITDQSQLVWNWSAILAASAIVQIAVVASLRGVPWGFKSACAYPASVLWRRSVSAIACLTIALPAVGVGARLAWRAPLPPPAAAPVPNGYEELLRAGVPLAQAGLSSLRPVRHHPWAREWIKRISRPHLEAARAGMTHSALVTVRYDESGAGRSTLEALHQLAVAFEMESEFAVQEGRDGDAMGILVDALRLGKMASDGGVFQNLDFGTSIRFRYGIQPLSRLRHRLSAEDRRTLLAALTDLELADESPASRLVRDRAWFDRSFNWQQRLARLLENAAYQTDWNAVVVGLRARDATMLRLLICEVAIDMHRMELGRDPDELAELAPSILAEIPLDPYSDRAFIYRRQEVGHVLYSVGADRVDNDGRPATGLFAPGDIVLDQYEFRGVPFAADAR